MAALTLFAWGYSGWGSSVPQLIRCLDAAEKSRGFREPILVDIRLRRAVRALGFRENALGAYLGDERYVWMPELGNENIGISKSGVQIADPSAVNDLIDQAIIARRSRRRVVFFCACESPDRAGDCHRRRVGTLTLAAARRREIRIEVVEWPGGQPKANRHPEFRVTRRVLGAVRSGARYAPLVVPGNSDALGLVASLPWGTPAVLRAGRDACTILTGPVHFRLKSWALPVIMLHRDGETPSAGQAQRHATAYRRDRSLDPRF